MDMSSESEVSVSEVSAVPLGGTAVLRCMSNTATRDSLMTLYTWQTDDGFSLSASDGASISASTALTTQQQNKYVTSDSGRVLLVRSVTSHDEKRRFRCTVYNKLTGRKANSVNWAKITIINGEYFNISLLSLLTGIQV